MATYTSDGEVYDAEDDPIFLHEELSEEERRNEEILKIHPFLKNRRVKIKAYKATREQGWTSGTPSRLVGKEGKVTKVHDRVTEAVEVSINGDTKFWHFNDLELLEPDPLPDPVLFNPLSLVVGE